MWVEWSSGVEPGFRGRHIANSKPLENYHLVNTIVTYIYIVSFNGKRITIWINFQSFVLVPHECQLLTCMIIINLHVHVHINVPASFYIVWVIYTYTKSVRVGERQIVNLKTSPLLQSDVSLHMHLHDCFSPHLFSFGVKLWPYFFL